MLQAILFDLDGTLLPMDTETFIGRYIKLLSEKLSNYLDSETFVKKLMAATGAMVTNTGGQNSNADIFTETFFASTGLAEKEIMPIFEHFYLNEYRQLGKDYEPLPLVKDILETAKSKGYQLVLATNPLFPLIAIEERLRWAGISSEAFILITSYENMHASKPNPLYFKQIAKIIDVAPERCLMVGNDVAEDLVAKKVGMQTFLVHDFMIRRNSIPVVTDYQGSLEDLYDFVNSLADAK